MRSLTTQRQAIEHKFSAGAGVTRQPHVAAAMDRRCPGSAHNTNVPIHFQQLGAEASGLPQELFHLQAEILEGFLFRERPVKCFAQPRLTSQAPDLAPRLQSEFFSELPDTFPRETITLSDRREGIPDVSQLSRYLRVVLVVDTSYMVL